MLSWVPTRLAAATSCCLLFEMNFRLVAKRLRSLFRSEVPLSFAEHFIAYHELLDGCRPEKRRIKMRVKLPMINLLRTERSAMPSHRIWERDSEKIIVSS